jgi:ribonuclease P protein component
MSVDKRATMRNRIRRLVSESVHHVLSDIHTGYDIVILVRRNIAANKQKDVEKIVKSMLEKTHGLITPKT